MPLVSLSCQSDDIVQNPDDSISCSGNWVFIQAEDDLANLTQVQLDQLLEPTLLAFVLAFSVRLIIYFLIKR